VDTSVVVLGPPEVRGTGEIYLGRNLLLYPDLYLETQPGASIKIADDVVISRGVHIVAYSGITIGAGSMIGEYTSIRDANHLRNANGTLRDGAHSAASIVIGAQVWIGRGVTILPGVNIGANATVGANAVVTRDVAPGTTVVGVPAVPLSLKPQTDPAERLAPRKHLSTMQAAKSNPQPMEKYDNGN
jgi:acetyltransferase-like isoleucine patch superfamily enzyme